MNHAEEGEPAQEDVKEEEEGEPEQKMDRVHSGGT